MQAPPWCLVRGRELVRGRQKGAQFTSSSSVLSEGTPFMFDIYIEELETTRRGPVGVGGAGGAQRQGAACTEFTIWGGERMDEQVDGQDNHHHLCFFGCAACGI